MLLSRNSGAKLHFFSLIDNDLNAIFANIPLFILFFSSFMPLMMLLSNK